MEKNNEKTIQELEAPVVDLSVDQSAVDTSIDTKYKRGRAHVHSRAMMPEKQLFGYAEYKAQEAFPLFFHAAACLSSTVIVGMMLEAKTS